MLKSKARDLRFPRVNAERYLELRQGFDDLFEAVPLFLPWDH